MEPTMTCPFCAQKMELGNIRAWRGFCARIPRRFAVSTQDFPAYFPKEALREGVYLDARKQGGPDFVLPDSWFCPRCRTIITHPVERRG